MTNSFSESSFNAVETAILAKCILHDTWTICLQVLVRRYHSRQLSITEKTALEEMYTSFFHQAFYRPLKSFRDVQFLINNTRRMLDMLKVMDEGAWLNAVSMNNCGLKGL